MTGKEQALLLTNLIGIGYTPEFMTDPANSGKTQLAAMGFAFVGVIWGVDFKGLPGQTVTPYGTVSTGPDGQTYVALRGTDSAEEWLSDGWAVPEPWPFAATGGRTHKGFSDVYSTLTVGTGQALLAYLSSFGEPVTVTGHSLGAALANLLAAALGSACGLCVTFEGPRVGDLAFVNWMDARVPSFYRYVIIGDIAPHAPPESFGYFHAGTEIDLDPAGVVPLTLDPEEYLLRHHQLSSVQELLSAP